jgi:iron(III) transport system permease protein
VHIVTGSLTVISWLPFTVPGIILGLALLWLFLGVGFLRPLYGTTALLIIAGVISGMPLGVQIIKSGLMQLGGELEEASRIAGATWWGTYRRIVLRLMTPTLMAVGMITFVGAARNIGNYALLSTTANRPLSILQLDYIAQGKLRGGGGGRLHHHVHLAGRGAVRAPARAAWQRLR